MLQRQFADLAIDPRPIDRRSGRTVPTGDTLHILLKYDADIQKARRRLAGLPSEAVVPPAPVDSFRQPDTRER